jgi:hypothetical protein
MFVVSFKEQKTLKRLQPRKASVLDLSKGLGQGLWDERSGFMGQFAFRKS